MFRILALILILCITSWSLYIYHDESLTNKGRNRIIGACLIFAIGILMNMNGSDLIGDIGLIITICDMFPLLFLFRKYFYKPLQK